MTKKTNQSSHDDWSSQKQNWLGGARGAMVLLCLSSLLFGVAGTVVGALSQPASEPSVAGVVVLRSDEQAASVQANGVPASTSIPAALPILDAVTLPLASSSDGASAQPIRTDSIVSAGGAQVDSGATDLAKIELGATLATAHVTEGTVAIFSEPDGAEAMWELSVPTEFGGLRHFLVVGRSGDWLEVQVPVRPNGSTGWIHRAEVELSGVAQRVRVDLSDRSVIVWDDDEIVLDTTSTVGRESSPTPQGNFYIRDIFEWDANSPYGPWVLALSSYSEVIDQINGGDAVVAIHGTSSPWNLGEAASLGCIRLDNETVTLLAGLIGPGTPIEIVA